MTCTQPKLPQLTGKICITDGGMETDFIFNRQIVLPDFASYDLLRTEEGYQTIYDYYKDFALLAKKHEVGLILETPTWRASLDWGKKIGDSLESLDHFNHQAVKLVKHIKREFGSEASPVIISGCIGPRGDGYTPDLFMTALESQNYHAIQIESLAKAGVDIISAMTLNYIDEATGIVLAAKQFNIPVCISFTVETDGKLPTGESLDEAIRTVDEATDSGPVYYMINCAHPTHFQEILGDGQCVNRLRGIRANASRCSHAELDEAEELDDGNPHELGQQFANIRKQFPHLNILGGCCGTDYRHIQKIVECCT